MTVIETPYGLISKQGPWYICPYCDAGVYETLGHMLRHMEKRHPEKKEEEPLSPSKEAQHPSQYSPHQSQPHTTVRTH